MGITTSQIFNVRQNGKKNQKNVLQNIFIYEIFFAPIFQ